MNYCAVKWLQLLIRTSPVITGDSRCLSRCQTWHRCQPICQLVPNMTSVPADVSVGVQRDTGASRCLSRCPTWHRCQPMSQSVPNVTPVPADVSVGAKRDTGASRCLSRCQTWHRCQLMSQSVPNITPVPWLRYTILQHRSGASVRLQIANIILIDRWNFNGKLQPS
jgi:hypothetical protein